MSPLTHGCSGLRLCRQLFLRLSPEEERVVCSHTVESLFVVPGGWSGLRASLSSPTGDLYSRLGLGEDGLWRLAEGLHGLKLVVRYLDLLGPLPVYAGA